MRTVIIGSGLDRAENGECEGHPDPHSLSRVVVDAVIASIVSAE